MEFKTNYGPKPHNQLSFEGDPGKTKQSFTDECDINEIMRKYDKTGNLTHVRDVLGTFGDFTSSQSYQDSCNSIIEAQNAFDALPSTVRDRMNNDPAQLLEFMANPDNTEEAIKLGLVAPPGEPSGEIKVIPETPDPGETPPDPGKD